MEKKKRTVYKILVIILVISLGLNIFFVLNQRPKDNHDYQRVGNLVFKLDGSFTHYDIDNEPMVGVTIEDNGDERISLKSYVYMEDMTEVKVMEALYDNYQEAAKEDPSFVYKDYHDMTESEMKSAGMGNGIEKVTVGTLKEGGALAWIYTDCGTYTVSIKSLTLSDKNCELCFGWQLNGIYTDKSLEPEYWED